MRYGLSTGFSQGSGLVMIKILCKVLRWGLSNGFSFGFAIMCDSVSFRTWYTCFYVLLWALICRGRPGFRGRGLGIWRKGLRISNLLFRARRPSCKQPNLKFEAERA